MRILITGNLGYVGTELTSYIRKYYPKYYLLGYDTGFFEKNLTLIKNKKIITVNKQVKKDIRDITELDLKDIDVVIHLAALSNDPIGKKYSKLTKSINFQSSKSLFKIAHKKNIKKFIFASSCSVYGLGGNSAKKEESKLDPLTEYAKSKVAFEKFVSIYNKKIIFTALRFSTACGISSRLRLDLVLNDFLASAILKNKIELLSKGDSWRPLIDVSDMCRAIDWAMHRKSLNNIIVNVGKEKNNIKILNLAKKVKKFFRNITLTVNRAAVSDNRSYKVDFSLFKKIAPYHQPIKNIDQTILELKNFLKKQEIQKDFRNSDLIRLKNLEKLRNADKINKDLYWN